MGIVCCSQMANCAVALSRVRRSFDSTSSDGSDVVFMSVGVILCSCSLHRGQVTPCPARDNHATSHFALRAMHDVALRCVGACCREGACTYLLPSCFAWAQYRCQALANDKTDGATAILDRSSCDFDRIVDGGREVNGGDEAERFNVRYPSY